MRNPTTPTTDGTTTEQRFERIAKQVHRFSSRDLAFSFADHATKALWVILGDDEKYWVTTPANCAALERMGYEYAN